MRVDVLKVLDPAEGIVFFRGDFGSASGRWKGHEPAETGHFAVEFTLPAAEEWTAATCEEPALSGAAEPGSDVWFRCQVERVYDDAVVVARMGPHIFYVEIPNRTSELPEGRFISFRVPEIELYPYDA
ncbi:hypothetical protein LFM09_04140 [Lentzea alba]|uniref:hypothetical protein n=1 Tax=Lentzea alba TaxID=2714351 RepID=UPI0039BF9A26